MISSDFEILSLSGLSSFKTVHELQLKLLDQRIRDEIKDTIIICEHTPVITRGRGLQFQADRKERAKPLPIIPEGTDYFEIERGGDLTWHGPGQLVVYPIVKLQEHDVEKWIRFQEQVWINVLKEFKIETHTQVGGSGVWLNEQGQEKKLASVGIALKRWVNYHGTAMNIINDLEPFFAFDPCGYGAEVMQKLENLPQIPKMFFAHDWREKFESLYLSHLKAALLTNENK